MPPPIVSALPPSPDLVNAHHGVSSANITLGPDNATPTKFHNPWPSYRFATLSDAWLAYQKGAAIATPQLPTPTPSRPGSRAASLRAPSIRRAAGGFRDNPDPEAGTGIGNGRPERPLSQRRKSWLTPDDPDDAADEDADEDADEYDDETAAMDDEPEFPLQHPYLNDVKGYVRPAFSRIMTQDDTDDWREPPIQVQRPQWPRSGERGAVTWLGHAGALVQIPWNDSASTSSTAPLCGVLFDPIFSYRCSPSQLVGPARHLDPPCSVDELPPIHLCLISHDHYDHLDYNTILDLWAFHAATVHFVVPIGLGNWFRTSGIPDSRITELDWWHEALVTFPSVNRTPPVNEPLSTYPPETTPTVDPTAALTLKVAFTPAQHRSGRGIFDHMCSLWGSWCVGVVGPGREADALRPGMLGWTDFKVFFGGDTGYRYATAPDNDATAVCPAFQEIAQKYSPFSLAFLPLSTGSSLPFLRSLLSLSLDQYTLTSSLHCSPADSLAIHATVGAQRSVGIHWGTFCDAAEARATRVEFGRARREHGVSADWDEVGGKGSFVVADIGMVMEL